MKRLMTLMALLLAGSAVNAQCTDLFFSEYIEGSSNNKALEIYNPTAGPIDLSNYEVHRFNNGGVTPSGTFDWPVGTIIASGDVYVVGNSQADPAILAVSDTTNGLTFFNGDDALILINTFTSDTLDVIGQLGVDPGTNWPVGSGATSENTLIRQINIQQGENAWVLASTQYDVYPVDMFDSLGFHTMTACGVVVLDPTVTLSSASQTVNEGIGTVNVDVIIANENANPTSVDLVLNVGSSSAIEGTDFTYTTTVTVTFPANSNATQTVSIPIIDDLILEPLETIVLDLTNPTNNASTAGITTHTITIDDNELAPDFGNCSDLFFSEYVEGSSNNKALEIYNPTCDSVDLGDYQVQRFTNGSITASGTYTFPAGTMLASQDVYVIGNGNADPIIIAVSDTTNAATFFNGDDAVTLMNLTSGDTLDIIGVVGEDPGTNWTVGAGATSEFTLVRSANIHDGTTDWTISMDQWEVLPSNTWDSLGAHYATQCSNPLVASFTVQDTISCVGTAVCFTNTTTGGACNQTVVYSFGDGNTSTSDNPCNIYPSVGNYACTLVVNDGNATSTSIVQITITDVLDATITSSPGIYCSSDVASTLTATTGGGLWSGNGITDPNAGTFDPALAGVGTHEIIYTISGACGNADTLLLTVSAPTVSMSALADACVYDALFTLTQGSPAGGTYSGTGVTGNMFDPAAAGIGTHTISYEYTDIDNCSATATTDIIVDGCVGLAEIDQIQLTLFPNPAKTAIHVNCSSNVESIEIYSLSGVQLERSETTTLSVVHLARGMYVLKAFTDAGVVTTNFIKE